VSDRARVLIVDDERDIVDLLQDILVELGYDVRPVFVSSDAVAVAGAFRPEVILLDIAMPGMMGAQVLEALRAAGILMPVIAISARPELAGPGFFDVIGKPARIDEVARTVAAAIRHHRGRGG
jgi:DNA-binding response OmpR family regulator